MTTPVAATVTVRSFLAANIRDIIATFDAHEAGLGAHHIPLRLRIPRSERGMGSTRRRPHRPPIRQPRGTHTAMNTCDDQSEPLGEAPDVPVRYDAGITSTLEAIQRGAVLGILSAADKITATAQLAERQGLALMAIRRRHVGGGDTAYWCRECGQRYPCPTISVIDEVGA